MRFTHAPLEQMPEQHCVLVVHELPPEVQEEHRLPAHIPEQQEELVEQLTAFALQVEQIPFEQKKDGSQSASEEQE